MSSSVPTANRRRALITLSCVLSLGVTAAARADHRFLVVNFDQNAQAGGPTGIVVDGIEFLQPLPLGAKDDAARDAIDALVDAHSDYDAIPVGDTTLWVYSTASDDILAANVASTQGVNVTALTVGGDVLMVDVDPRDTSADVENDSVETMATAGGGPLSVTIVSSPSYDYDPGATDTDETAAAGLMAAGIGALPGALRIGTAILVPHCALDFSSVLSSDSILGMGTVRMDGHIPCLVPPGDTSVPGGFAFEVEPRLDCAKAISWPDNSPGTASRLQVLTPSEGVQGSVEFPGPALGQTIGLERDGQGVYYTINLPDQSLYSLDSVGQATLVGSITGLSGPVAEGDLAYDPTTETMYACCEVVGGANVGVFELNTGTAAAVPVGVIADPDPLDGFDVDVSYLGFTGTGDLYAIDNTNGGLSATEAFLLELNDSDASTASVTSLPALGDIGGMDYDPASGRFFLVDSSSIGSGTNRMRSVHPTIGLLGYGPALTPAVSGLALCTAGLGGGGGGGVPVLPPWAVGVLAAALLGGGALSAVRVARTRSPARDFRCASTPLSPAVWASRWSWSCPQRERSSRCMSSSRFGMPAQNRIRVRAGSQPSTRIGCAVTGSPQAVRSDANHL